MEILLEATGWLAVALTLTAYSSKTMLPLRMAAIGANISFIVYSLSFSIWPTLVLHLALLPLNALRLFQILRLRQRAVMQPSSSDAFSWITEVQKPERFPKGQVIFRRGDKADRIYYLVSGEVRLEEIGRKIGSNTLFGEIAFFNDPRERTATAACLTDCSIVTLDERRFMSAFHQDPVFGLAIVRLIAKRLIENARQPQAPARTSQADFTIRTAGNDTPGASGTLTGPRSTKPSAR